MIHRLKRVFVLLCAMGLMLIFILGCLEIYLRIRGPLYLRALVSEGKFLEMKDGEIFLHPNVTTRLLSRTGEFEHEVHINSAGFRDDRELSPVKPRGETRIGFLGDSFTFGYGSDFTNTIPYLVEQQLNAKNPSSHYRSLNFGFRSGNCPRPQYIFFKREVPKYQLDEVYWLLFFGNDLEEMNYFQVVQKDELGLPAKLEVPSGNITNFLKHFAVWQMIRVPLKGWIMNRTSRSMDTQKNGKEVENPYESQIDEIKKMAVVMNQQCNASHQKLHIVMVVGYESPNLSSPIAKVRQRFMKLMGAERISTMCLSNAFSSIPSNKLGDYYYIGDGHYTPKGNRLVSHYIVETTLSTHPADAKSK
jgi:hypothetical protein